MRTFDCHIDKLCVLLHDKNKSASDPHIYHTSYQVSTLTDMSVLVTMKECVGNSCDSVVIMNEPVDLHSHACDRVDRNRTKI
jgi:hypothetical protein